MVAPGVNDPRWLNDRDNYHSDIKGLVIPDDFIELLQKSKFIDELKLPLLFYAENRGPQKKLYITTIHWEAGRLKQKGSSASRHLLEDGDYLKKLIKEQTSLNNRMILTRGIALQSSCQIEYLVKVLTCAKLNAYKSKETELLAEKLLEKGGNFGSLSRRIDFLRKNEDFIPNSYDFLKLVKQIRNELAHSFFPEYIVPNEWIWEGEDQIDALLRIIENTWFYLLKDLAIHQGIMEKIIIQRMKVS